MNIRNTVISAAILGMSSSAFAFNSWTVDEDVVTGLTTDDITVDLLNGRYTASIDQAAGVPLPDPLPPGVDSILRADFVEEGIGSFTSYFLNNSGAASFINSPQPVGYGIYGEFTISGYIDFITSGAVTTAVGTILGGDVELWLDDNNDSLGNFDSPNGLFPVNTIIAANTGDDTSIGTASAVSTADSEIIVSDGLAAGSYKVLFTDWALSAFGATYWPTPEDFYMITEISGENETFDPALTAGAYEGYVNGDVSAIFAPAVPEPSTIALLGLSLAGFGAYRRSKKRA